MFDTVYALVSVCSWTQGLLGKGTRAHMVNWLAATIEGNTERGKMQWSHEKGASHGFFLNHNAVMLALSGPFIDSPNFWKRCVCVSVCVCVCMCVRLSIPVVERCAALYWGARAQYTAAWVCAAQASLYLATSCVACLQHNVCMRRYSVQCGCDITWCVQPGQLWTRRHACS